MKRGNMVCPERQLSRMLVYLLMIPTINFCIYALYNLTRIPILGSIDSLVLYPILYVWMGFSFLQKRKHRLKWSFILYAAFWILAILLSLYRENVIWGLRHNHFLLWILGAGLPSFYIMVQLKDMDEANRLLMRISRPATIVLLILYYTSLPYVANRYSPSHYMFFSGGAAWLTCVLLYSSLKRHRKTDLILTAVLTITVVLGGARGGMLPVLCTWMLYWWVNRKYGRILLTIGVIAGVYILIVSLSDWLLGFEPIRASRTMNIILNSGITSDSGRGEIYSSAMAYFGKQSLPKQLFGLGVGGERRFIAENVIEVGYVHNIFLELILQFGYVGGGLLIGALVVISVYGVRYMAGNPGAALLGIVILSSMASLLVSGSYAMSCPFHLWIGLCAMAFESDHRRWMDRAK